MSRQYDQVVCYIPHLRRYARALMGNNRLAADDLVQDCLERALSRLHLWRKGSDMRAWLFTIMHNLYVNQIRKHMNAPPFTDMEVEQAGGHNSVEANMEVNDVQKAIGLLSPDQREVLLLVTLEGMKYQEVAAIMGVPEGTVMSKLSRARDKLRDILQMDKPGRLRRVK